MHPRMILFIKEIVIWITRDEKKKIQPCESCCPRQNF